MSLRTYKLCLATLMLVATSRLLVADPLLKLQYGSFDPVKTSRSLAAQATAVSTSPYKIVQFTGRIRPEWIKSLLGCGVQIINYIPDYAYLVKMPIGGDSVVKSLKGVRFVGPYLAEYKAKPSLWKKPMTKPLDMSIKLLPGENVQTFISTLKKSGVKVVSYSNKPSGSVVRVNTTPAIASKLVQNASIQWIEQRPVAKLFNDVARGISTVNTTWNNLGLFGSGQIIAVCDSGLDTGDENTLLDDFKGRIKAAYGLGREGDWSDPHGHGTHTAGTVLGNGALSGSDPATHNYETSFAGAAPEAQLVMQSVLDDEFGLGGLPDDLNTLFQQAYDQGAKIHSNSWGYTLPGEYITPCQEVDEFVWNNPDMVIVFSAGNDGVDANRDGRVDYGSVSPPATAKNCIAVGATESLRPSAGMYYPWGYWGYMPNSWYPLFPTNPIYSDAPSNNIMGMAAFSGRGPTTDRRIKPDVCAPGTNILSCKSSIASGDYYGYYYNNPQYQYMSGTSMSCPQVAGISALVREYFLTQLGATSVSAAMVKAVLINGAKDITPGQYGTGPKQEIQRRPDNMQGWGRVDLANSLTSPTNGYLEFHDITEGMDSYEQNSYQFDVEEGDMLQVTLVYTDRPGAPQVAVELVNDLDLTVYDPMGRYFYPNGLGTYDSLNTVEDTVVPASESVKGRYYVWVDGYNITTPEGQPYALVVRCVRGTPDLTKSTMTRLPDDRAVSAGDTITYTITVKGSGSPTANTIVTNAIPTGTTYVEGSTTLNGVAVDDVAGTSPLVGGMLVNSPDKDPGVVSRTADAVVTFSVEVDDDLAPGIDVTNSATITANDMDTLDLSVTNRTPVVIKVKPGGTGDGSSWENACGSMDDVQEILLSADEVWVAAGTYRTHITIPDNVKFLGGFAGDEDFESQRNPENNVTILDGGYTGSVVTVAPNATSSTIVDGFTITNGKGTLCVAGTQKWYNGGGIFCADASPIISNNKITANIVTHLGGGIYIRGGSPRVINNDISGNMARHTGLTGYGAGIYCGSSTATIQWNTISNNKANNGGGGICCPPSTSPSIMYNKINGNGAMNGGAVYCDASATPTLANNWMTGNKATVGGGVFCSKYANANIINNTIAYNQASPGGGIAIYTASPTIANNIVANNSNGICRVGPNIPVLKNNCVYYNVAYNYSGLTAGTGDFSKNPLFVSVPTGNYHISGSSPCINTGFSALANPSWTDIDGSTRIQGTKVDVGADEVR